MLNSQGHLLTETADFWRSPAYPDLDLLHATYIDLTFDRHAHEEYAIGVIERGSEQFYYRGGNHTVSTGQIVIVMPGEIHTAQPIDSEGWTYRMFYPGVTLMGQIAHELTGREQSLPFFASPTINDAPLAALFLQAHRTLENTRANASERLAGDVLLREALGTFIARHATERPPAATIRSDEHRHAVQVARDYINAHYSEPIALDVLAQHTHFSPFHLARLFQKGVGMPPHVYLTHVRLTRAKALLGAGIDITRTALDVGFANQSHFTRRFKHAFGVTPGQYQLGAIGA